MEASDNLCICNKITIKASLKVFFNIRHQLSKFLQQITMHDLDKLASSHIHKRRSSCTDLLTQVAEIRPHQHHLALCVLTQVGKIGPRQLMTLDRVLNKPDKNLIFDGIIFFCL